jgi:hypothetical protein
MPSNLSSVKTYVTKEEKRRIQKNAASHSMSVSRFLSFAGSRDALPPTEAERNAYLDLIYEVKMAGNNLNQIARALNVGRKTGNQPEAAAVNKAVEECREAFITAVTKLTGKL